MDKEQEIRANWKVVWGGRLVGSMMWVLGRTLRVEMTGWREEFSDPKNQFIHAFWHNRICALLPVWTSRFHLRNSNTVVLSSASKDGAAIEAAVGIYGLGAVRGSSSRRGAAALIALKKAAKAGKDLIITPDGPRGPRYSMQPGVIKLGQTTGLPIIPITLLVDECWRLKTWDRFIIPKPFSRMTLIFGEPLELPRKLSEDEFEAARLKLQTLMREGINDLPEDTE
ncbi:MAG: lysophospholipid acyltransferase family protein [Akkermansiaceae bacterium]|nr:lysophospholipid acyltransferase family protein [Akkermansiaceae bacterium]